MAIFLIINNAHFATIATPFFCIRTEVLPLLHYFPSLLAGHPL